MTGSPMLISISLKGADVVLVESVIRAAREAAGNHWQGCEFGVPLFNRDAVADGDDS